MAARRQMPAGNRGQGTLRAGAEAAVRTVTVACKLPNGLILQIFEPVPGFEQGPGNQRIPVVNQVRLPQSFKVHGNSFHVGGRMPKYDITADCGHGFGLTPGIPEEFWDTWLEQNKDAEYVKNGFIFGVKQKDDAVVRAHEYESVPSGLEPIDPDNLPREFRPRRRKGGEEVGGITTHERDN